MMKHIVSVLFLGLLSAGVLSARGQDTTENPTVLYYHNLLFEGTSLTGRPPWVVGIKQEGGQFLEHPNRWVIESGQPEGTGELVVKLDREELESDVALTLIFEKNPETDLAVQLLDESNRVVAVDLVGNPAAVGQEGIADTFALPLMHYPTATQIALRRVSGPVTLYGIVLVPVIVGDESQAELMSQIDLLKQLKQPLSPDSPTWQAISRLMQEKTSSGSAGGIASATASSATTQPSGQDAVATASGMPVGVAHAHGKLWDRGADTLREAGYEPIPLEHSLNATNLQNIRVLIISGIAHDSNSQSFDPAETDAVEEFVRNGGGLVCAGQAWSWVYKEYGNKPIEDYPINMVGRKLGFTITGSNIGAPTYSDPILLGGIGTMQRTGWWPSEVAFESKEASPLIRDENLRIIAGTIDYGKGRIVVVGCEGILIENPRLVEKLMSYVSSGSSR